MPIKPIAFASETFAVWDTGAVMGTADADGSREAFACDAVNGMQSLESVPTDLGVDFSDAS